MIKTLAVCALVTAAYAQSPPPSPTARGADDAVARGRAIHARLLTLDTHKDIEPQLATETKSEDPEQQRRYRELYDPTVRGTCQVDFPKMREGGYDCAFFIVYVGQARLDGAGFLRAKKDALLKFDAVDRMVAKHGGDIALARSPAEVRAIAGAGKLVACIGVENPYPLGEDLALIEEFHRRGARYISLAHNGHSQIADSHTPADEPLHKGLSELGRRAIAEMNRVGIMVDVSHASRDAMMQAALLSKAPVIASHSGCRAVRDHSRNLDDEQLKALAKCGGVIQINSVASFVRDQGAGEEALSALRRELDVPNRRDLSDLEKTEAGVPEEVRARLAEFDRRRVAVDAKYPPASVTDFVDHVDHAVKLIGIDHVGIGSDFDGGGGVAGWKDASESPNVTIELVRRGYSEGDIAKIWSGNLLRVWEQVERVAAELRAKH